MQYELFQNFINSISLLTKEQLVILECALSNIRQDSSEKDEMREDADKNVSVSVKPPSAAGAFETTTFLPGFESYDSESSNKKTLPAAVPDLETNILSHFAECPQCPKCQSQKIGRWGFQSGRQRYHCNTCNATFNAFTGTSLARLRHPEKWNGYLAGMTYSMTLRPAAKAYGINLKTSFRWRHRFLEVINNDQAEELCGITELDETMFRESFKGQRKGLPRPARKRSNDPTKAGKVPVMVARDRQCHTVDGILKDESADELCRHLNGRISIEATVCADALLAHEKLAKKLGFEFKELVTSKGQRVLEGIYHIQNVNAYHSGLKRWISGVFHGVATRYLPHYLAWRRDISGAVEFNVDQFVRRISEHWSFQLLKGT
ncbi:IS1595 family transposase [Endozoicomonas sp.]|uniref:IS1595 family transposase n=1 Tax=Endozoicomonas sp. TaxID=1892382 RepID=UPI00383B3D7C